MIPVGHHLECGSCPSWCEYGWITLDMNLWIYKLIINHLVDSDPVAAPTKTCLKDDKDGGSVEGTWSENEGLNNRHKGHSRKMVIWLTRTTITTIRRRATMTRRTTIITRTWRKIRIRRKIIRQNNNNKMKKKKMKKKHNMKNKNNNNHNRNQPTKTAATATRTTIWI